MCNSIKPATLRDLTFIGSKLNRQDHSEIAALIDEDMRAVAASHLGKFAFCAWRNNQPIAAFGASPYMGATWTAWMFGREGSWRAAPKITGFCKILADHLKDTQGVRRIEARSLSTHTKAHRWIRRAFDCPEPIPMPNFGRNGETFLLFSKEL